MSRYTNPEYGHGVDDDAPRYAYETMGEELSAMSRELNQLTRDRDALAAECARLRRANGVLRKVASAMYDWHIWRGATRPGIKHGIRCVYHLWQAARDARARKAVSQ